MQAHIAPEAQMGRQAYLTKIALGRSAFEPSQAAPTPSAEYVQLESSQQELPLAARESNVNKYIQLYDEGGNPINPRAYEHGRSFRQAQNDVLSSIGVVQRRRSPSEDLPGCYEERLEQLDSEDSIGNAIALTSTLTENLCTWWIGSLRDRILTFRVRDAIPFSQIAASEYHASGTSIVYAGFASRLLSTLGVQATVYAAFILRPLDRLVVATRASSKTKSRLRQWRTELSLCFRVLTEVAFYPFAYHACLQRLGLIPAKQLPYWKAFIPFSKWSPIKPFLRYQELVVPSSVSASEGFMRGLKAGILVPLTSPLVFICLEHFLERLVYAVIYEAIETTVIHPENPDLISPDDGTRSRASAILGLRKRSPSLIRNTVNKMLIALGWGMSSPSEPDEPPHQIPQTLEVSGQQVINVNRLQMTAANPSSSQIASISALPNQVLTPPSPTATEASQDDSDPRIRITSREGIVEMEVRLPPHALTTHIDSFGTAPASPDHGNASTPTPVRDMGSRAYHRVTQLSTEPSQMIGAICKSQIVGWVTFPLKLVTLRLVATHFLASNPGHMASHRVLDPLPRLHDLSVRSVGLLFSRVALCGLLEVAIDLSLWGIQYTAVLWAGKSFFGWGGL